MNFLALVQDLARQSGTLAGGTSIASVSGVSGRADKLVNWIQSAWQDIQNARRWNWLRDDFELPVLAATARYTAASMNLDRFGSWAEDSRYFRHMTIYDPDIGQSDEQELAQISYEDWKIRYGRGTHTANRPIEWAISPSAEFLLGPTPDKEYTVMGEYWKSAQSLSANADTPESPERYHKAIVYRAMQIMAGSDESVPTLQRANLEFGRLYNAMCSDPTCLRPWSIHGDGPLA